MLVTSLQLNPDEKPFLGVGDRRALELLAEALSQAVTEEYEKGNPELLRMAREYATGRSAVFVAWHTEPAANIKR